jgi:hypothetical protein
VLSVVEVVLSVVEVVLSVVDVVLSVVDVVLSVVDVVPARTGWAANDNRPVTPKKRPIASGHRRFLNERSTIIDLPP